MKSPRYAPRRPRRFEGGLVYLQCPCPMHNGAWIPEDDFGLQTYKVKDGSVRSIRKGTCQRYLRLNYSLTRYPDLPARGRVRLDLMEKWLYEIIRISGGYNAAARTLQMTPSGLYRWLRRYKGTNAKWMSAVSAQHVMATLKGLRDGSIIPDAPRRTGGVTFKQGCVTCGTPLHLPTPGCPQCWEREYRRAGHRRVG